MSFLDFLKSLNNNSLLDLSPQDESLSTVAKNKTPDSIIQEKIDNLASNPNVPDMLSGDYLGTGTPTEPLTAENFGEKVDAPIIYPEDLFGAKTKFDIATMSTKIENKPAPFIYFIMRDSNLASSESLAKLALYMPPDISVKYGAQWETTQLQVEQAVAAGKTAMSSVEGMSDADMSLNSIIQSQGGYGAARALATAIDSAKSSSLSSELDVRSRKTVNPHQAMMFKGVDFREFKFDFDLQARSYEESIAIRKIIKLFKWAMHPSKPDDGLFFTYPNIFDIYLYTGDNNKWMFNIAQCVLTSMDVNYGGASATSFFGSGDGDLGSGAPVYVKLSVSFKELSILTKENIKDNY
jgi:hypothetical protein